MAVSHAFLDILASPQIRDAYLAGRIAIILSPDLESILWTNGAGAYFMGMRTVAETIGVDSGFDKLTRHQIEAGLMIPKPVRVSGIGQGQSFLVSRTQLSRLGDVVFLRSVNAVAGEDGRVNLIEGLSDETTAAAVFDFAGHVIQASGNFDPAWFDAEELGQLLAEAHADGRVKKRFLQKNPAIPIGVLELNHEPAIFLLIAAKSDETRDKANRQDGDFVFNPAQLPLRFGWRVDEAGQFCEVSSELEHCVGKKFADISGRSFAKLAVDWHMDSHGTVRALFKSHNAWGPQKIYWPVEGSDTRVEITFFALPVYSKQREFVGFRGFAIIDKMQTVLADSGSQIGAQNIAGGLSAQEHETFSLIARTLQADLQQDEAKEGEAQTAGAKVENRFLEETGKQQNVRKDGVSTEVEQAVERYVAATGREERVDALQSMTTPNTDESREPLAEETLTRKRLAETSGGPIQQPADLYAAIEETRPEGDGKEDACLPAILVFEQPTTCTFLQPSQESDFVSFLSYGDMQIKTELQTRLPKYPRKSRIYETVLQGLMRHVPASILVYRDNKVLFASDHLLQVTGFSSLDSLRVHGVLTSILRDWLPKNILQGAGGAIFPVRAHMRAVRWIDDETASMICFLPDDARQTNVLRQNLNDLQKKAIELSGLFNLVSDGVLVVDGRGMIHSFNDGAIRIFKLDPQKLRGQIFKLFFAESEHERLERCFQDVRQGREVSHAVEFAEAKDSEGNVLFLHVRFSHMETGEGTYLLLSDVTKLHDLEREREPLIWQKEAGHQKISPALARIGHQIRTPLTAVKGLSQLILAEKYGSLNNDRYRSYLRDIVSSSEHIMHLLEQLDEDDARSDKKTDDEEPQSDIKKLDLALLLSDVLTLMSTQANLRRIIMRSSLAADLAPVMANPAACRQICINLLANAIHSTPVGGQVIVSVQNILPEGVLFRVRDTGAGLTVADVETALQNGQDFSLELAWLEELQGGKAFDNISFSPIPVLAMTHKLVEANNARFNLQSQPGQGTLAEVVFIQA